MDTTLSDSLYHSVLTGIALGDRRSHSAFKRARISEDMGNSALDYLIQTGIITREPSREIPVQRDYPTQKLKKEIEKHQISDKFIFATPFLRFWFAFISPLFHGIQEGDYEEVKKRFENREQGLSSLIFEQLSIELLKQNFQDDPIVESGSYWDREVEIDILAKTASGKIIVGECKYTNTKVNKSELTRLKEKCEKVGIQADIYVLFGKRGFSNELKNLKGADLRLWTLKSFKKLIENLDDKDKIQGFEPSRY